MLSSKMLSESLGTAEGGRHHWHWVWHRAQLPINSAHRPSPFPRPATPASYGPLGELAPPLGTANAEFTLRQASHPSITSQTYMTTALRTPLPPLRASHHRHPSTCFLAPVASSLCRRVPNCSEARLPPGLSQILTWVLVEAVPMGLSQAVCS